MKKSVQSLFLLLFLSTSATAEVDRDCFTMSDQALICTYKGETGLELLPEVELHNVQRLPIFLSSGFGSVVLVKNVYIEGLIFSECWSVAHQADRELLIFCQQLKSYPGEIPQIILSEIEKLRAN